LLRGGNAGIKVADFGPEGPSTSIIWWISTKETLENPMIINDFEVSRTPSSINIYDH
jgi:hypothetical protein